MYKRFLIISLILGSSLSWAQESAREVRQKTKGVEAETAREKELHAQEQKNQQAYLKVFKEKQQSLQQQDKALQMQIDSLKTELHNLEAERAKEQQLVQWYEGRRQRYGASLAKTIDSIVPLLRQDFPVQHEAAADAVADISEQLRKKIIGPEEALGRVFDVLVDRMQMGHNTENWSGFLTIDGRSVPGKYVRYGAVAALFVSQDGQDIYYLKRSDNNYVWQSVGHDLETRQWFKETLRVSEAKSAPSLVILPFSGFSQGGK